MTFKDYLNKLYLGNHLQVQYNVTEYSNESNVHPKYAKLITGDGSATTFWDSFATIGELRQILEIVENEKRNVLFQQMEVSRQEISGQSENESKVDDEIQGFKFTLADLIHLTNPQARIILILRDPTER